MLSTEAPQHLKHSCNQEEFRAYVDGVKTFDLKLNAGDFNLEAGDLITFVECDTATGVPTGETLTKKISYVLNTKNITNITDEDLTQKGITVFSLVAEEYKTLASIYDTNFTVSIAIDKKENESWELLEQPAYTPAIRCPDLVENGVLEGLHINKWPEGRYSATLMATVSLDKVGPPYELEIVDVMVTTVLTETGEIKDLMFVDLNPAMLMTGHTITIDTNEKVTPTKLDDLMEMLSQDLTEEQLEDNPELLSDENMQELVLQARARGEAMEMIPDDTTYDEEDEEDI